MNGIIQGNFEDDPNMKYSLKFIEELQYLHYFRENSFKLKNNNF